MLPVKNRQATLLLTNSRPEVTGRTCATKKLPNFRMSFLARFASKPLFHWVVLSNCSENKAFSPKKGLVFAVNGPRRPSPPPPPPPTPRPRPPPLFPGGRGGFTENPRGGGSFQERGGGGGGQGCARGIWGGGAGGAEAPFTAKTSPFCGENALNLWCCSCDFLALGYLFFGS